MKCEPHRNVSQPVPTLGCPPTLPALGASPLPRRLASSPAVCLSIRPAVQARWHKPYLEEEVVKLFSTQRTMKAL